jgi:hypothetical protein
MAQMGHMAFGLVAHETRREVPVDGGAFGVKIGAGLLRRR